MFMTVQFPSCVWGPASAAVPVSEPTKKPQPEDARLSRFLSAAALPVGPSLDQRRGVVDRTDRPSPYKWHANSAAQEKPFGINRKKLTAALRATAGCRDPLHCGRNSGDLLCGAKN